MVLEEKIRQCRRCGLCRKHSPIIKETVKANVFFVGISAKKNALPLDSNTETGQLIQKIEDSCEGIKFYLERKSAERLRNI